MRQRSLELIYALTKKVTENMKDERLCTSEQLRIANLMRELNEAFSSVGITPASPIDIIDRQEALAIKVWSEEDIINQAEEMGLEPTKAVIDHIKRFGGLKGLEECADPEWNAISDAIRSAAAVSGPCNTEIHYTYRDADNYKMHQYVVVKGLITSEQEEKIKSFMEKDGNTLRFIPEQVDMPETRFERLTTADHCWFEFDFFVHSEKLNTMDGTTVDEVVEKFKVTNGKWDDTRFAMENPEIFKDDEEEEEC